VIEPQINTHLSFSLGSILNWKSYFHEDALTNLCSAGIKRHIQPNGREKLRNKIEYQLRWCASIYRWRRGHQLGRALVDCPATFLSPLLVNSSISYFDGLQTIDFIGMRSPQYEISVE
jgi:hypothetical protein